MPNSQESASVTRSNPQRPYTRHRPTSLLSLPQELRQKIYQNALLHFKPEARLYLLRDGGLETRPEDFQPALTLIPEIRVEALEAFFEHATFTVVTSYDGKGFGPCGPLFFLPMRPVPDRDVQQMRNLEIEISYLLMINITMFNGLQEPQPRHPRCERPWLEQWTVRGTRHVLTLEPLSAEVWCLNCEGTLARIAASMSHHLERMLETKTKVFLTSADITNLLVNIDLAIEIAERLRCWIEHAVRRSHDMEVLKSTDAENNGPVNCSTLTLSELARRDAAPRG